MLNLQTYYHFKLNFQKVDQHTGGKWLTHGTKCHKDNQLQSLELPCRNIPVGNVNMTYRSLKVISSIQYSTWISMGRNIQGVAHLQNQNYLGTESLNV